MKNTKVLLIQNQISNYRVNTYNLIAQEVKNLTVAYYDKDESLNEECLFDKFKYNVNRIGPFYFENKALTQLKNNFDVVIYMGNLQDLSYVFSALLPQKYKKMTWSIGMRASYTRPYDVYRKHTFADWVYGFLMKRMDACIFYMNKPKEFWGKSISENPKVFVANNTTSVLPVEIIERNKRDLLFVGTLYKSKGIDKLIKAMYEVKKDLGKVSKLHVVGQGDQRKELEDLVKFYSLQDDVLFHGPIYNEIELAKLFSSSILCISPTQAGLSVPKSMGYGVTFVTKNDAITGGELYHITNGVNGLLYESDSELIGILTKAVLNPSLFVNMGRNAKEYYDSNATVRHMAEGALRAISYALDN